MKKHRLGIKFCLLLIAILILLPVVLTFLYSFFAPAEIKSFMETRSQYGDSLMEIKLSPRMASLEQYWHVLIEDMSILRYYFNSLCYTAAILIGQALIVPALAYALSRFQFPGRDALSFLIIMLLLLPFQVTMVPTVLTLRGLSFRPSRPRSISFCFAKAWLGYRENYLKRRKSTARGRSGAIFMWRCPYPRR